MLPAVVKADLTRHLECVRREHDGDLRPEPAGHFEDHAAKPPNG
jgi:hypothetical protein